MIPRDKKKQKNRKGKEFESSTLKSKYWYGANCEERNFYFNSYLFFLLIFYCSGPFKIFVMITRSGFQIFQPERKYVLYCIYNRHNEKDPDLLHLFFSVQRQRIYKDEKYIYKFPNWVIMIIMITDISQRCRT